MSTDEMRLLIADDDRSLRTALRMVFEAAGYEVLQAEHTSDVRALLPHETPDVVLIDASMRDGGIDLWKELQEDELYRERALLLTGNLPSLGSLGEHRSVFGKPFDYETLIDHIKAVGPRQ